MTLQQMKGIEMTLTDTIRELRELPLGRLEDATVQNLQTAFTFLPQLLAAAEQYEALQLKAERYEKALRDCDYHADILKTCIEQKFSQQEIAIAINNVIQAGADAAKALAPEPEKEIGG